MARPGQRPPQRRMAAVAAVAVSSPAAAEAGPPPRFLRPAARPGASEAGGARPGRPGSGGRREAAEGRAGAERGGFSPGSRQVQAPRWLCGGQAALLEG